MRARILLVFRHICSSKSIFEALYYLLFISRVCTVSNTLANIEPIPLPIIYIPINSKCFMLGAKKK